MNGKFFSAVYKYSPIGLAIINESMQIADVNDYMLKSFHLNASGYKYKQFGSVFGCSEIAGTDKMCGTSPECSGCSLRNGIANVLKNDITISEEILSHSFVIGGVNTVKWFKLSASAIDEESGRFAIVSFVDITREKQYEELLKRELTLDLATGAINKQSLVEILMDLSKYAEPGSIVSVGIIDMDDFKYINDTYGHLKGDEVLQKFSEIARENIRRQDILGRFGGEEFMFVIVGADITLSAKILKRIHDSLVRHFEQQGIKNISFSAGFMELHSDDIGKTTKDQIIDAVDGYLYKAKRSGKKMLVSRDFSINF